MYFSMSYYLIYLCPLISFFFFFNDTATTEIYTLSLHDALPISFGWGGVFITLACVSALGALGAGYLNVLNARAAARSEEHTSELQSPCNLVCRLLLEKKKTNQKPLDGRYGEHASRLSTDSPPQR